MFEITKATEADFDAIWPIFKDIVKTGDTYVYDPEISKEGAFSVWFDPKSHTYIAKLDGAIIGAFVIRPNHRDLGNHIANAAYIIDAKHQNKGYGRKMAEMSFVEAKKLGYLGMQFNYVVSTNERAVKLWQSYGFEIVGTVPNAHRHQQLGRTVPIYIMYKRL